MHPDALRERTFHFGTIRARQSISVLGDGPTAYLYLCTTFTLPLSEKESAIHSGGSRIAFADADILTDEKKREQFAIEHMEKLAGELRLAANTLSIALSERAQADALAKKAHLEAVS